MLLPIKPVCDHRKVRRDNTAVIFIQYCYSAEHRTLLNTEIAIPPQYWNRKRLSIASNLPEKFGDAESLNDALKKMLRLAEDLAAIGEQRKITDKGAFVKQLFKPGLDITTIEKSEEEIIEAAVVKSNKKVNDDFFFQVDDYIKSKEKKVSPGMIKVYEHMRDRLKSFEEFSMEKIMFNRLNYDFYDKLVEFLSYNYVHKRRKEKLVGLKVNSIGQTIKQFRIFIKDRVRRKIIPAIDLTDFKIIDEETDAIYLSTDEIAHIYHTDLSEYPYLVEYRELFVLACLTGLRFIDFSTLKPEDLRKGMLYKKQDKSDHWVVIPLRKEAKEIFTQQFRDKIPDLTNAEFNRHIKVIGKLAGLNEKITFSYKKGNKDIRVTKNKHDWITTHTARRSFCTNEFLAGTPVKLIMKISGHKSEHDFYKYIRITPEEAAGKIKELWLQRNDLEAFSDQLKKIS